MEGVFGYAPDRPEHRPSLGWEGKDRVGRDREMGDEPILSEH
jgi:hypothetical protein